MRARKLDTVGRGEQSGDRPSADARRSGTAVPHQHRDVAVDLVRIVGVLAVVTGHLWTSGWVRDALFTWHVPVFFVLTGYLWQTRSWRRELAARTSTLVRPYLGCLVLVTVTVAGLARLAPDAVAAAPTDPLALLRGGAELSGPFTAFWFVSCLAAACLLYAAVGDDPLLRVTVVGTAVVAGAVGAGWLATLPLSIGVALPALVLLEAGRQLRRWARALDHPLAAVLALMILVAATVAVTTGALSPLDMKVGDLGRHPGGLLAAAAISGALITLARHAVRRIGEGGTQHLATLAGALVPVVLLHPLVLIVPAPEPVRFVLAVAVPLAVALAARRTPLSGWLTGR